MRTTRWQLRLQRLARRLGIQRDWFLLAIGAGIGTVTAFGSIGFVLAFRAVEHAVHDAVEQDWWVWWLLPIFPMAGALLTGLMIHFFAREARGHGVPEVMSDLYRRRGRIRPRVAIVKSLASISTIGSGGSAGAEGPIVQIGAALGSGAAQLLRISREHTATLLGCGAAAGIASVFNAPIAGVFFAMEIILRDFSLRTFTPIVVASVFSAAVTQAMLGNEAIFAVSAEVRGLQFTFPELPSYAVMGLLCGVVAVGFTRLLYTGEATCDRLRVHPVIKPVIGAALLGLLGIGFLLAGRASGVEPGLPPFFGNGYGTIRAMLSPANFEAAGGEETAALARESGANIPATVWMFIVLLAAKAVATTLTLGSGGSGGVFAPSLFLGASAGAAFGTALEQLGLLPEGASPAAYALVGMAAVVAGTTHAPLTAILIVFELTRDIYVLLPIMLAAVFSTLTAQLLLRDSIYTLKLRRRGVLIGTSADMTLLRRITASQVPVVPHVAVRPDDPASKLIELNQRYKVVDFVVLDHDGRYLGMVTAEDMRTALLSREAIPLLLVSELVRTDLPTVDPEETLDSVLNKFSRHDVSSLAMVRSSPAKDAENGKVIGLLTRGRLMSRYQKALSER